jgi:5-methylcytosine-specific restriction endonuclease McrBC GTP-binding regulatory subunit McrB
VDCEINLEKNMQIDDEYIALLKANKNLILTGAPGTGKTYLARQIAKRMIYPDKKVEEVSDEELEKSEQYKFVQFHPSYDYTDFVEGLRPTKPDEKGNIRFKLERGIFKEFCYKANCGINNFEEAWNNFYGKIKEKKGKYNIKTEKNKGERMFLETTGRGIGGVKKVGSPSISVNKDQCYKVYCGLPGVSKKGHDAYRKAIILHLKESFGLKDYKYIFLIDEINRGEISKIFGELFFSIDFGYRGIGGAVKTQYSNMHNDKEEGIFKNGFYVPKNVYIIGTMNDIDRSVESFDFAMRRRFVWEEISAKESQRMFNNESWKEKAIKRMDSLNNAIEKTEGLNSSYHIGAAYFKNNLPKYKDNEMFDNLWKYHLKPLLKEYLRGIPDEKTELKKLENAYYDRSDNN